MTPTHYMCAPNLWQPRNGTNLPHAPESAERESTQLDELGGGDTHRHSLSPTCSPQFSSCQRHAVSVFPAAFKLFRCQGATAACTLLMSLAGSPSAFCCASREWSHATVCSEEEFQIPAQFSSINTSILVLLSLAWLKGEKTERYKMSVED